MSSCLTVTEFLLQTGNEFVNFGAQSTGNVTIDTVPSVGNTFTIGGVVFIAVAGARTSGSKDYSLASGTVAGVAASLVDAINDAANGASTFVTAAVRTPGLAIIDLTSVAYGVYSLIPMSTSVPLVMLLSAATLEGGDLLLTNILSSACSMLNPDCWGTKLPMGHLYLAAHMMFMAEGLDTGEVSSKTIDKISISYSTTAYPTEDAYFNSSKWGRMYLALRATLPSSLGVTSSRNFVGWVC